MPSPGFCMEPLCVAYIVGCSNSFLGDVIHSLPFEGGFFSAKKKIARSNLVTLSIKFVIFILQ